MARLAEKKKKRGQTTSSSTAIADWPGKSQKIHQKWDRTATNSVSESLMAQQRKHPTCRARRGGSRTNVLTSTRGVLYSLSRCERILTMDGHQLRVWRTMGCDSNDDRIPHPHVLPLDMSVVLRWSTHPPDVRRRYKAVPGENVDAR